VKSSRRNHIQTSPRHKESGCDFGHFVTIFNAISVAFWRHVIAEMANRPGLSLRP
jgi:hypothetical protein